MGLSQERKETSKSEGELSLAFILNGALKIFDETKFQGLSDNLSNS